jgi:hypothetical protein
VSLNGPNAEAKVSFPVKGEKLQLGEIGQVSNDPRTQLALKRLAEDKASTTLSQLVMWNVSGGLDWATIAQISRTWANPYEVTLARQFASSLDNLPKGDSGVVFIEVKGNEGLANDFAEIFKKSNFLGLTVEKGVPAAPAGAAVAVSIDAKDGKDVSVVLQISDDHGKAWKSAGKFDLPLVKKDSKLDSIATADSIASGVLGRLVKADLVKGKKVKGKDTYTVRIDNYSPLVLNGLALSGNEDGVDQAPKMLNGVSLSPRKSFAVPATLEVVERLGLKKGVRITAVDLSGL